jgi:hypothetical protein
VPSPPRSRGRRHWLSGLAGRAAAATLAVAMVGCVPARAVPTPIIVVVTFAPTSGPTDADSPAPIPTDAPTPSPTVEPTPVVVGGPSASPSPGRSATPAATAAPASACSGTSANKAFWGQVAATLQWPVYCPILPSGWVVRSGTFDGSPPGRVEVTFDGPEGATLKVDEGEFCTAGASTCAPHVAEIGPASFGDLPGTLDSTSGGFAVYVNPGTSLAYTISGTGLSQDAFVAISSGIVRIAP